MCGSVEPRYKSLNVALVPQPREVPPPPFATEDLQRIFSEVIRKHAYQTFEFVFNGRGAQFTNGPEDVVEIRPALFQVQAKMDGQDVLTAGAANDKVQGILKIAADRLRIETFLQCVIQIIAFVPAPDEDSKAFVADRLMHDAEQAQAAELGPEYFGGGVRFRRLKPDGGGEDALSIEPFVGNFSLVWLSHEVTRANQLIALDQASNWIGEAFDFVAGPTMRLLSR